MSNANPFAAGAYEPPSLPAAAPSGGDKAALLPASEVQPSVAVPMPSAVGGPPPGGRKKNWPICYPIAYHDIGMDIPAAHRMNVRAAYLLWMVTVFSLWWNALAVLLLCTCSKPVDVTSYTTISDFLYALVAAILGSFGSWKGWYRGLYSGLANEGRSSFTCFFLMFTLHVLFGAALLIGVPGTGGFIPLIHVLKWKSVTDPYHGPIFTLGVNIALWGVIFIVSCLFMTKFRKDYQRQGQQSFQNVKADLASGAVAGATRLAQSDAARNAATAAMQNQQVRQAATNAATNAMQNPEVRQAATKAVVAQVTASHAEPEQNPFDA